MSAGRYAPVSAGTVDSIDRLKNVAAATGALVLNDVKISLTIPSFGGDGGSGNGSGTGQPVRGSFKPPVTFTASGADLSTGAIGPLASGKITSGRTFTVADASKNVAVGRQGLRRTT